MTREREGGVEGEEDRRRLLVEELICFGLISALFMSQVEAQDQKNSKERHSRKKWLREGIVK